METLTTRALAKGEDERSSSTTTPNQTKKLGEILAKEILKTKPKKRLRPSRHPPKGPLALIIGLVGDLGGGKTTFLQGLAKGLGIKENILSPTFVILKKFQMGPKRSLGGRWVGWSPKFKNFYHIDCYRIKKPKEILFLDFKKIVSNPKNIVAIEWADKIRKIMPEDAIWIKFEFLGKNKRKITLFSMTC